MESSMFIALLVVLLSTSTIVSFLVALLFVKPIGIILKQIISEHVVNAWSRFFVFAICVVGIAGGAPIYNLEKYIEPPTEDFIPPVLNGDRWFLEIYGAIINSLESIVWMLLVFFFFALVAYAILRILGGKSKNDSLSNKK